MGKQFSVYLLPSDAVHLIEALRQKIDLRLLSPRSEKASPAVIQSPLATKGKFTRIDCLMARSAQAKIHTEHIEKQGYWGVDILISEVIELKGCHFDEKTLKRGRFFYTPGFYKDNKWQNKSSGFLDWAETLFKLAKQNLKRDPELDAYVGEEAIRWHRAGGVFIELAIRDRPPIIAANGST